MTTIKFGLSGDVHVNLPKRSDEAWRIAWWMLEDWKARGVHLIGISGDLVDGPMTERERARLIEYGDACAQVAPLVICDGNHEIEMALRNALGGRSGKYPIIVEDGAAVHVVETTAGSVAIACVSFPKKAKILAVAGPRSDEDIDAIAGKALQDVFRGIGVKIRALGLPSIGLVHGAIKGSKISSDDQPDRPLGMDIDIADLALMNCDFTSVGHIHAANKYSWNDRIIAATPTCPFYSDYGEAKHQKGYILAEIRDVFDNPHERIDEGLNPWKVAWERIPTPAVPMILFEANYSTEDQGFVWLNGPTVTHEGLVHPAGAGLEGDESETVRGADIRFRFHCAADQRKAAGVAASEYADKLFASGAVNVKLEEVVTPTTKARIPGLSKAISLWHKMFLYWKSIDFKPTEDRRAALKECLNTLLDEAAAAGLGMGTAGRAAPMLKRIRGKGFLKLPGEFDIDFGPLGDLTTIVAPNESGKTILLQLMSAGVMYGSTPTRGSLDDLSIAKDSFIEATFEMGGAEYVLTQNCNGMSRSGSVGLTKNGVPELSKAGRAEYKKDWADKWLLPDTVYNAVICQSGTTSVIDLKEGPRVELLLRVLGLETYEVLAESARKRSAVITTELAQIKAKIEELRDRATLEFYQEEVNRHTADLRTAEEELRLGEITLADLRSKNNAVLKAQGEYDAVVALRKDLEARVVGLDQRITETNRKLTNNRTVVGEADQIRAAVETTATLQAHLTTLQAREIGIRAAQQDAHTKWAASNAALQHLNEKLESLRNVVRENEQLLAQKEAVLLAVQMEQERTKEISRLNTEIARYRNEIDTIQTDSTSVKDRRIDGLRGGYKSIIDDPMQVMVTLAEQKLEDDDSIEAEAIGYPAHLLECREQIRILTAEANTQGIALRANTALAGRLPDVEAAEARLAKANEDVVATQATIDAIDVVAERAAVDSHGNWSLAIGREIEITKGEMEGYKPYIKKAGPLAQAEARIEELTATLGDLNDDREKVYADMCDATDKINDAGGTRPVALNLHEYEDAVSLARTRAQSYQGFLTAAQSSLKTVEDKAVRRAELTAQIKGLESQQADWMLLGLHLGKDHLQKAEISDSGPQLTAITNDLLRLAGDTRHTVSIETEKLHSNKKQMIPTLDINVFDSEEGLTKESRRLSDAGKVIVGWPFGLALIVLGCERLGIKGPTIFIDEATGPCDVVNGPRCASMLRHFAERLQSQVVYIAQQPEIQAFADATIRIDEGVVTVS